MKNLILIFLVVLYAHYACCHISDWFEYIEKFLFPDGSNGSDKKRLNNDYIRGFETQYLIEKLRNGIISSKTELTKKQRLVDSLHNAILDKENGLIVLESKNKETVTNLDNVSLIKVPKTLINEVKDTFETFAYPYNNFTDEVKKVGKLIHKTEHCCKPLSPTFTTQINRITSANTKYEEDIDLLSKLNITCSSAISSITTDIENIKQNLKNNKNSSASAIDSLHDEFKKTKDSVISEVDQIVKSLQDQTDSVKPKKDEIAALNEKLQEIKENEIDVRKQMETMRQNLTQLQTERGNLNLEEKLKDFNEGIQNCKCEVELFKSDQVSRTKKMNDQIALADGDVKKMSSKVESLKENFLNVNITNVKMQTKIKNVTVVLNEEIVHLTRDVNFLVNYYNVTFKDRQIVTLEELKVLNNDANNFLEELRKMTPM